MESIRSCIVLALALSIVAPGSVSARDPEARTVMQRTFDQARVSFRGKMRLVSPGGLERLIDVHHRQIGQSSSTYMEITAPFNLRDTRFLSFEHVGRENEHFTYVPMIKRSMRVPKWTLEQSFLGSDFYMVDIAVPDMSKFEYSFSGEREVAGTTTRCIASEPTVAGDEPYAKVVYCVDETKWLSLYTEYFDENGKLLKIWEPLKIEEIQGIWTPRDQTMRNVQSDTKSQLEILAIEYHVELRDELFSKAHLDR